MLLFPTTIFFILFQIALWIPTTAGSFVPNITEFSQFRGALESADKDMMAKIRNIHVCDRWQDRIIDPWDEVDFVNKDLWDAKRVLGQCVKKGSVESQV